MDTKPTFSNISHVWQAFISWGRRRRIEHFTKRWADYTTRTQIHLLVSYSGPVWYRATVANEPEGSLRIDVVVAVYVARQPPSLSSKSRLECVWSILARAVIVTSEMTHGVSNAYKGILPSSWRTSVAPARRLPSTLTSKQAPVPDYCLSSPKVLVRNRLLVQLCASLCRIN